MTSFWTGSIFSGELTADYLATVEEVNGDRAAVEHFMGALSLDAARPAENGRLIALLAPDLAPRELAMRFDGTGEVRMDVQDMTHPEAVETLGPAGVGALFTLAEKRAGAE